MANILDPTDPQFGSQFGGIGGQGSAPWYTGPSGTPGDPRKPGQQGTPPPPAVPGSITTDPGFTPNYPAIIRSDPGFIAAQHAASAAEAQAAADRRAAIRNQFIQYGGDWSGFTDKYGDIDQATRDLAKNNQYSTLAGLARALAISQRQQDQQLAARGMLQSGDLAYGLNQLNTGYGQNLYDAGNAFGNQLNQDLSTYTGVLGQNARDLVAATQAAYGNAIQNPAYQPRAAQHADFDGAASAKYGVTLYSRLNDDGVTKTYYTQDGKVWTGK